jgi:thymidylate synthase
MGGDGTLSADAIDVPCACTLQFLLRSGSLDAVVYMRSNDVVWGLPYDVFLFTMLQEMLAVSLGVKVGTYFHTVASLHLYEKHLALARNVLASPASEEFEMPAMPDLDALPRFLSIEETLRKETGPLRANNATMGPYWTELAEVLAEYARVRHGRESEFAIPARYSSMLAALKRKKHAARSAVGK